MRELAGAVEDQADDEHDSGDDQGVPGRERAAQRRHGASARTVTVSPLSGFYLNRDAPGAAFVPSRLNRADLMRQRLQRAWERAGRLQERTDSFLDVVQDEWQRAFGDRD